MKTEKKGLNVLGAISDMVIFVLLVGGAGFIGYFIGINQKLAPVQIVPPGTIEAIKKVVEHTTNTQLDLRENSPVPPVPTTEPASTPAPPAPSQSSSSVPKNDAAAESIAQSIKTANAQDGKVATKSDKPVGNEKNKTKPGAKGKAKESPAVATGGGKKKFWIASSGNDYIGSSVTVAVNGRPVDNFFGPGKLVDVSSLVKKGNNVVTFASKVLDDAYNQHLGDDKFALTLKLVSGSVVSEAFNSSEVLVSFRRTAAEMEDGSKSMDFACRD